MALTVRLATVADRLDIIDFWNFQRTQDTSWFRYAPQINGQFLAKVLAHDFNILVCRDEADAFLGFGMYKGAKITGFTAKTRVAFYRLLRAYCVRNPNVNAFSVMPAIASQELNWLQSLGANVDITAIGWEPLTPEQTAGKTRAEILAMRKAWLRRCNAASNEIATAIDTFFGV